MNEFANYEISLRMKKLGFDEPCLAVYRGGSLYGSGTSVSRYYDEGHWELEKNSNYGGDIEQWVSAPTWQSAFAWFHRTYGYYSIPQYGNLVQDSLAFYLEKLIEQAEKESDNNN